MNQKIAILTDSSSSIYTMEHKYDNIFMIDLPCYIGDVMFSDFAKNNDNLFYEAIRNTNLIAKTSQPSVGETLQMFEHIKSLGYTDIIYIPISKELSGTYQNGFISKDLIEGVNVEIIDTKTTVSILAWMAIKAAELAKKGVELKEIIVEIQKINAKSGYFVTVNDLTSLVKNGRLSNAKSIIANLLRIKPVIELTSEGKLVSLENVRTYKNAIKRMVDHIKDRLDPINGEIHIAYTDNKDTLEFLMDIVKEQFPTTKIVVVSIPSTVVAHLGLAAIGIGYINY